MVITDVEVITLRVPGWHGQDFDGSYDNCVIRVHTDAGRIGIGEVDSVPSVVKAIIDAETSHTHARGLRDVVVGRDPLDPALWDDMYDATNYYGRRGVVVHAISGIDIALWDLRAQVAGVSLAEALGGRKRDRIKAYGTVYPLGEHPDDVRKNLDRGLALGLRAIKIVADPFWRDDATVVELIVRTAREHVGPDIALMVDCATAWKTADQGVPLMPIFAANDFSWVEAPLPIDDLDGHARFQGFGVPIGGGDLGLTTHFEYEQLFDRGRVDIAQPDVTMVGGLTELLKVSEVAGSRGKRVVTHGYKSNITIAANLAFLSQHRDEEVLEYSTSESPLRWELTNERFPIDADGYVTVPSGPGLGVTLDESVLERFRH